MTTSKAAATRKKNNNFIQPIYGDKECSNCAGTGKIVDHLGRRVRLLRLKHGLSDLDLMNTVSITKRKLTQIETGASNPTVIEAMALCAALNCTSDYLLGLTNNPKGKLR